MPRAFYFGCVDRRGHFLFEAGGGSRNEAVRYSGNNPWGDKIDGGLCPDVLTQGHAALHHRDGYTALAFWDYSLDDRTGSNSVFIAEGTHDFVAMKRIASQRFPKIWARFTFPVIPAI